METLLTYGLLVFKIDFTYLRVRDLPWQSQPQTGNWEISAGLPCGWQGRWYPGHPLLLARCALAGAGIGSGARLRAWGSNRVGDAPCASALNQTSAQVTKHLHRAVFIWLK